jgi:hypothetical protein
MNKGCAKDQKIPPKEPIYLLENSRLINSKIRLWFWRRVKKKLDFFIDYIAK